MECNATPLSKRSRGRGFRPVSHEDRVPAIATNGQEKSEALKLSQFLCHNYSFHVHKTVTSIEGVDRVKVYWK